MSLRSIVVASCLLLVCACSESEPSRGASAQPTATATTTPVASATTSPTPRASPRASPPSPELCAEDASCGEHEICTATGCLPAVLCRDDSECGARGRCLLGRCRGAFSPGTARPRLGGACGSDDECDRGARCLLPAAGFPDGICTQRCSAARACAEGFRCVTTHRQQEPVCLPDCASGAAQACREGYMCAELGVWGAMQVCVPGVACSRDGDCAPGQRCRRGGCQRPDPREP